MGFSSRTATVPLDRRPICFQAISASGIKRGFFTVQDKARHQRRSYVFKKSNIVEKCRHRLIYLDSDVFGCAYGVAPERETTAHFRATNLVDEIMRSDVVIDTAPDPRL